MLARHLPGTTGAEAIRVVRALGAHRYVAGRLHLIHALAFDALSVANAPHLSDACAWARAMLDDPTLELESKDPRLYRSASAEEICGVLEGFWVPTPMADEAHDRLLERFHEIGLDVPLHAPFDEAVEGEMHPVLIDAGWELLPLSSLDPVRHQGAILAFDEPILYESARF